MGPPYKIFTINKMFPEDLFDEELNFQLAKSQCYITEEFRNEEWEEL